MGRVHWGKISEIRENLIVMDTTHKVYIGNAENLEMVNDDEIDLIVTSPPYPMIEMWDDLFNDLNNEIGTALNDGDGWTAFELMHMELNKVWDEIDRVIKPNRIICINIGDATRKIGEHFQLYPNHTQIINYFTNKGYYHLPSIIWKKPTNKPTKFMGSGMLPPNAYITLEHEHILIFRKKGNRKFTTDYEREERQKSAYFWEERNRWFTDIWEDIKGTDQKLDDNTLRERNGAYPIEVPYRLINMYSVKNDTVLDPFLGTGTTTIASILTGRNSIGYEINPNFKKHIIEKIYEQISLMNEYNQKRINNHEQFISERDKIKKVKYSHKKYGFGVITRQETMMELQNIKKVKTKSNNSIIIEYEDI